jgi:hypothetical protein
MCLLLYSCLFHCQGSIYTFDHVSVRFHYLGHVLFGPVVPTRFVLEQDVVDPIVPNKFIHVMSVSTGPTRFVVVQTVVDPIILTKYVHAVPDPIVHIRYQVLELIP